MGKTVQNAFARAETLDCQTVVFLVEEKASFLPVLDIYQIADTIFISTFVSNGSPIKPL